MTNEQTVNARSEPPTPSTGEGQPGVSLWRPQWTVNVGHGCELGIVVDDHCFVVLCENTAGQWRPATHIPKAAALLIGELAAKGEGD